MPADHSPDPARHRERRRRANRNNLPDGLPLLIGTAAAVFVALVLVAVVAGVGYHAIQGEQEPKPAAVAVPPQETTPVSVQPATAAVAAQPATADTPPAPRTAPTLDEAAHRTLIAAYCDNRLNAESVYRGTRWRFRARFNELGFRLRDGIQADVYAFGSVSTILWLSYSDARSLHAGRVYIFEGDVGFVDTFDGQVDFKHVTLVGPAPTPPPPKPPPPAPRATPRTPTGKGGALGYNPPLPYRPK